MTADEREPEIQPEEIQVPQEQVGEPPRPALDENQMATLVRLLRAMYPHPQFPDGPYRRCAEAVRDNAQTDLVEGLSRLDEMFGGPIRDADDETALRFIEKLGEDHCVVAVHGVAVNTLYDDHEVWNILGYEGASFEKGGYINRGFNDLDWLPEPRITEYEGDPRVENVPLAQNAGGN